MFFVNGTGMQLVKPPNRAAGATINFEETTLYLRNFEVMTKTSENVPKFQAIDKKHFEW